MHRWRFGQPLGNRMHAPNACLFILRSLDKGEQLSDDLRLIPEGDIVETMCVSHMVTLYGQTY